MDHLYKLQETCLARHHAFFLLRERLIEFLSLIGINHTGFPLEKPAGNRIQCAGIQHQRLSFRDRDQVERGETDLHITQNVHEIMLVTPLLINIPEGLPGESFYRPVILRLFGSDRVIGFHSSVFLFHATVRKPACKRFCRRCRAALILLQNLCAFGRRLPGEIQK